MEQIILLGSGGHACSVTDSIMQLNRYEIAGYVEREITAEKVVTGGIPLLGTDDDLKVIYDSGIRNAFVTIGYLGKSTIREQIYNRLKQIGYNIPSIIDPTAILANNVKIEEGVFVGKRAVINSNSRIGKMCIVNTGAIVEHDNEIGEFSHIAVGAVLCGAVKVGKRTFIGANSVVIQGIDIGDDVIIGAGTTVRHDVESRRTYYGK